MLTGTAAFVLSGVEPLPCFVGLAAEVANAEEQEIPRYVGDDQHDDSEPGKESQQIQNDKTEK